MYVFSDYPVSLLKGASGSTIVEGDWLRKSPIVMKCTILSQLEEEEDLMERKESLLRNCTQ